MKSISIEIVFDDSDEQELEEAINLFLKARLTNYPMIGIVMYAMSIPEWAECDAIQSLFPRPGFTCSICNRTTPQDENCGHDICLDCAENDHCTSCRGFIKMRGAG